VLESHSINSSNKSGVLLLHSSLEALYQNVAEDVTATIVYARFKAALLIAHKAQYAVRNMP
jgi:hypothetical protein